MIVVLLHDGEQFFTGLAKPGNKYWTIVRYRDGASVGTTKVANSQTRYNWYPKDNVDPKRVARRFRKAGVANMTKAARKIIEECLA